jgi:hypothetical protein
MAAPIGLWINGQKEMRHEGYYYKILSPIEKSAYSMIYRGLKTCQLRIVVDLDITSEQLRKVFLKVMYDNPILFYVDQTVMRRIGEPGNWILWPVYLYDKRETDYLNIKIRECVDKIAARVKSFSDNEFMVEKYLHDYLIKNVSYDPDEKKNGRSSDAHSIAGVFVEKKAVCEGISKAFKFLCDEFGIKCTVVYGKAGYENHSWNLVILREEPYHVDVTWDCVYCYDYFNLTTAEIMKDHMPEGTYPLCTSTRFHMRKIRRERFI